MVQRVWRQVSPYFHIIAFVLSMAFTAGLVSANVSGYEGRIAKLESNDVVKGQSLVRIEQKVDDLHNYFLGRAGK